MSELITKYFNNKENWDHYASGSFKIGTVKGYRDNEAVTERMSDQMEGKIPEMIAYGGMQIDNLNLPGGGTLINVSAEPQEFGEPHVGMFLGYPLELDANIFCASKGGYDSEHHDLMMYGDGNGYSGNCDLDAYAVIDLDMFGKALFYWMVGYFEIPRSKWSEHSVQSNDIIYGKRGEGLKSTIPPRNGEISQELFNSLVLTKPSGFRLENEKRICMFPEFPKIGGPDIKDQFPASDSLRKAIVEMGNVL